MGKDADTIYGEIKAHRRRISDQMDHLERRVQGDVEQVKERVATHTPGPPSMLTDRASEHPLTAIAVGFGLGIAAGMLSESMGHVMSRNGNGHSRDYRDSRNGNDGRGSDFLEVGGLSKMLFGFAGDAVRPLIDDVVAGFKGDERTPIQRTQDEERQRERSYQSV